MKVLIVDDSTFSQRTTSTFLKKYIENIDICFASDGKEGFKKYKDCNPDYVFVDLLMPNINGKDLIKLLKEWDKDAKIIVLTADVQKSVKEEVSALDVVSFINKPLSEDKARSICDIMRNDINE